MWRFVWLIVMSQFENGHSQKDYRHNYQLF